MDQHRVDVFTTEEVKRAKEIVRTCVHPDQAHKRILNEIVTPEVVERINRETGQPNLARYMAYRLEYVATAD